MRAGSNHEQFGSISPAGRGSAHPANARPTDHCHRRPRSSTRAQCPEVCSGSRGAGPAAASAPLFLEGFQPRGNEEVAAAASNSVVRPRSPPSDKRTRSPRAAPGVTAVEPPNGPAAAPAPRLPRDLEVRDMCRRHRNQPDRYEISRAAPTLPGTTRIRLPSTPPTCYDRPTMKVSHLHSKHSASRRKPNMGLEPVFRSYRHTDPYVSVIPIPGAVVADRGTRIRPSTIAGRPAVSRSMDMA